MFKVFLVLTFILLAFFTGETRAYVLNQTKNGSPIHWPLGTTTLDLYVNATNSQGVSSTTVQNIAQNSVNAWNGKSTFQVRKNSSSQTNQEGFNELYFSSDPEFFSGSATLGVTQVAFHDNTGEIVEADILINDDFNFSTASLDKEYLGNVLTHEIGHFLGLGHSQVTGATMFYAIARGQHLVDSDDEAGVLAIYPNGDSTKGMISGMMVGGQSLIPVFGTQVQAISVHSGVVMGAAVSDSSGHFYIKGLPKDDQYFLYSSPIKQLGLPTNYSSVKSDFCTGSKSYRGSFFQACGARSQGFPTAVSLDSSSVNVGKITIRCDIDSPPEYVLGKHDSPATFDLGVNTFSGLGGSFVGSFTTSELYSANPHDNLRLDLSRVSDWDSYSTDPLYLQVRVLTQSFYSPIKANVIISHDSGATSPASEYVRQADGWINIESVVRLPINRLTPSDNDFEISITPVNLRYQDATSRPTLPYAKSDLYPSDGILLDGLNFYLASASIVKLNNDGLTYSPVSYKIESLTDNAQCPDAGNTYALSSYTTGADDSQDSTQNRRSFLGCATVDLDGGKPGDGPGGFMVGFMLTILLAYSLRRYSKIA